MLIGPLFCTFSTQAYPMLDSCPEYEYLGTLHTDLRSVFLRLLLLAIKELSTRRVPNMLLSLPFCS